MKAPHSISFALVLALLLPILTSCSTVPEFTPSKPIEQADSLTEALEICNQYRIDEKNYTKKSSVLVPWLRCLEKTIQNFDQAKFREDIVLFFHALNTRYEAASRLEKYKIDREKINQAVALSFSYLLEERKFNEEERKILNSELSSFSMYLAEKGAYSKNQIQTASVAQEPLVDLSKADWGEEEENLFSLLKIPAPKAAKKRLNAEDKEFCQKYRKFKNLFSNYMELKIYKTGLDRKVNPEESSEKETSIQTKVSERFFLRQKELQELNKDLVFQLKNIQTSQAWFHPGFCL